MRYTNSLFLLYLIFCYLINNLEAKHSIKTISDTIVLDYNVDTVSLIQIKVDENLCSRNSIKSQIKKTNRPCSEFSYS